MLRAVYEFDREKAATYLANLGRPIEEKVDRWIFLAIYNDEVHVGYMYYSWINKTAMQFHIYLSPGVRKRWNRRFLRTIHFFPEILGASLLVAKELTAEAEILARSSGWQVDTEGVWSIHLPCKWSL